MEMRMIGVRIDTETAARVEAEAASRKCSVSDIARAALQAYFRPREPVSAVERVILSYLISTRRILNSVATAQLGPERVAALVAETDQAMPGRLAEVLRDIEAASHA